MVNIYIYIYDKNLKNLFNSPWWAIKSGKIDILLEYGMTGF